MLEKKMILCFYRHMRGRTVFLYIYLIIVSCWTNNHTTIIFRIDIYNKSKYNESRESRVKYHETRYGSFSPLQGEERVEDFRKNAGMQEVSLVFEMKDRRLLGAADINFMLCRGAGAR